MNGLDAVTLPTTKRIQLYTWIQANKTLLSNTLSLVFTTIVTGVLGFTYWWIAAREYSPHVVGLASAAVSAMTLLGAICILGLGTLLIGELPRQPGKEWSLINAALLLVGGVGICGGLLFVLLAPLVSADFQTFRANLSSMLLFAAGVSLTSIVVVLDQALIGLLRGSLQFWRNTLFSIVKLVLLFLAAFWLVKGSETIYGTWVAGIAISLLPLFGLILVQVSREKKAFSPDWKSLRKLGLPALQHHLLNLILQVPVTAMPVLVTTVLSATINAWFYVSWMLSGLVFIASYALTTVLYAISPSQSNELTRKIRVTLGLSLITALVGNVFFQFGATQILSLFGPMYAVQAAWCLRILSLGAFPTIIKDHYIAVGRIHSQITRVALPVAIGSILELGGAAVGGRVDGLIGLSLGWVTAVSIEALFMLPTVYKVTFPAQQSFWHRARQTFVVKQEWKLSSERSVLKGLDETEPTLKIPVQVLKGLDETEPTLKIPTHVPEDTDKTEPTLKIPAQVLKGMDETEPTLKIPAQALKDRNETEPTLKIPAQVLEDRNETEPTLRIPTSKKHMPINTSKCAHCNATLPEHAKFCGVCGTKVAKSITIPSTVPLVSTILGVLLPLFAIVLWSFSLHAINLRAMTDLGLVSVLPASVIVALLILTISFCVALNQRKMQVPIVLLHILLLIFMLYGITTLIEEVPRFAIVYRHAGYVDYIMRTGGVDPSLDAYFNWPGFFIFSAFLTQIAGYHDILSFAAWSAVAFNLMYLGPMYIIFTTVTKDKRIIWLALWFFFVTNWIAQDYYSPQGLNFFTYLLIIAILLKWFKSPMPVVPRKMPRQLQRLGRFSAPAQWLYEWLFAPDDTGVTLASTQPRKRLVLLICVLAIFTFIVSSHPLTPFLTIASVLALAIFNRITPRWLPIAMIGITVAWLVFMAQAYLAGHLSALFSDVGQFGGAITSNVTDRATSANPEHSFIADLRILMTLFMWVLALAGGILRLRKGHRDATYVLLAVAPFPILLVQSYGGEMLMRIYLFTLPFMVFFAASLFYTASGKNTSRWMKRASIVLCVVLLSGFLFTRYGNERMDYVTSAELTGLRHLYNTAPPNSLLIESWEGTPWEFQNYEQYDHYTLSDTLIPAIETKNVNAVVQLIESTNAPRSYILFTRTERATAQGEGLPPGTLDSLEHALLSSGKFVMVYSNTDAQILQFTDTGKAS